MPKLSDTEIANLAIRALGIGANVSTLETAVAVCLAESGGITTKVSTTGDYGLWQINHRAHPQYDTKKLLSDPLANAQAMAAISHGGADWTPWVAFKTGAYKAFAARAKKAVGGSTEVGVSGDVTNAVDSVTGWVPELLAGASKALLGLVLATAGLGVAALGLARLTGAPDKAKKALSTAATAGTAAGLVT